MTTKQINIQKANDWIKRLSNSSIMEDINRSIDDLFVYELDKDASRRILNDKEIEILIAHKCDNECEVQLTNDKSHIALIKLNNEYPDKKLAVLNCASYFRPGGGFLKGNISQEECLCFNSALFPILEKSGVYDERLQRKDIKPEYQSEIMCTPYVPFFKGKDLNDKFYVDVISVSPPNKNRKGVTNDIIQTAIKERLENVFLSAAIQDTDCLILHGWGCSNMNFKMIRYIIDTFNDLLSRYKNLFDKIVFTIPNERLYDIFNDYLIY